MNVCGSVSKGAGVGEQSSTREGLLGIKAWGSPEGTARLEEPLAGQRLNKRWRGKYLSGRPGALGGPMPQRRRQTDARKEGRKEE